MKRASEQVIAAAASFIDALRPEDSLGLLTFADKVDVAHAITTNRQNTVETLSKYQAEGGTALYDALCDSLLMLKGLKGRRAVVILSDGRDEDNPGTGPGSVRSWESVLHLLQNQDVTMFPVGLGPRIDAQRLELLAALSGGQVYFPQDVTTLGAEFARVIENLRHRYIVGYTSTNAVRDGKWRNVEIRARSAGVRITSRKGYYAPQR
jgi:VWFA-related protein